jgi:hypothetical protein
VAKNCARKFGKRAAAPFKTTQPIALKREKDWQQRPLPLPPQKPPFAISIGKMRKKCKRSGEEKKLKNVPFFFFFFFSFKFLFQIQS